MIRTTFLAVALVAAAAPALAQDSLPRAQAMARAEAEFVKVDVNKDGQMSRTEIETFQRVSITTANAARAKAVFERLDSDKNGQLSPAEFAKVNSAAPKVDASDVLRIDTNKDGQISLAEHKAATLATFTSVDANKDGVLTATEVRAVAEKK